MKRKLFGLGCLLLLIVCLLILAQAATATYMYETDAYTLLLEKDRHSEQLIVTGFAETPTQEIALLEIPAEVEGLPVAVIKQEAFQTISTAVKAGSSFCLKNKLQFLISEIIVFLSKC